MAYFVSKGSAVYLYYYKEGKATPLPRKLTKHLDHADEAFRRAFMEDWLFKNGHKRADRAVLTNQDAIDLVHKFLAFLRSEERAEGTINQYRQMLLEHCLPYFVHREHDLPDPNSWISHAPKLIDHLKAKHLSADIIVRCNVSMRQFWKWLQEEQVVVTTSPLVLRSVKLKQSDTPLKVINSPSEVLQFLERCTDKHIKFIYLMGYFFSLRPQEIFAARRSQFIAGAKAADLECCKVMSKVGLFGRLAFKVDDQRDKKGKLTGAKSGSKGWVSCFNKDAAELVVELVKELGTELFFNKHQNDFWFRHWAKHGPKEVTIKDLRRMSLYHLGHDSDLSPIALKNHARHTKIETTMKYMRRPETTPIQDTDLDLAL
ncbi:MAG: hypothetical protein EOP10_06870 [Proteobacteria bacterium]|nr:MAG: hypothetical protein EOP10_06870 [Pseudomonadota bacterium]